MTPSIIMTVVFITCAVYLFIAAFFPERWSEIKERHHPALPRIFLWMSRASFITFKIGVLFCISLMLFLAYTAYNMPESTETPPSTSNCLIPKVDNSVESL